MLIFVTIVLGILAVLFLATAGLAVHRQQEAEKALDDAWEHAADLERQLRATAGMVDPLTWIWNHVETRTFENMVEESHVVRHHLVNAFVSLRLALDLDDEEMAQVIEMAAEPPRRLPRYPQVPPFLASPEDAAQIPPMREGGR